MYLFMLLVLADFALPASRYFDSPPPMRISASSVWPAFITQTTVRELQLAMFLQNMESSYFQTGLQNMSQWGDKVFPNSTVEIISQIVKQGELYTETIADLLDAFNAEMIPSCRHSFPVTSFEGFLLFGDVVSSLGLSASLGIAERVSATDPPLVPVIVSQATVKARQDSVLRNIGGREPNPSAFDTGIPAIWAYNLALSFVLPGSCSVEIPIPLLPTLSAAASVPGNVTPSETAPYTNFSSAQQRPLQMEFTWDPAVVPSALTNARALYAGWLNQLRGPMYTRLSLVGQGKGIALIPEAVTGVVFVAVTSQQPALASELAFATLAGPVIFFLRSG